MKHQLTSILVASGALLLAACAPQGSTPEENALEIFSTAANKGSLISACDDLSRRCKLSGGGTLACLASQLFCGPDVPSICAKLHRLCDNMGIGCDVAQKHCGSKPQPDFRIIHDAPPPPKDFGPLDFYIWPDAPPPLPDALPADGHLPSDGPMTSESVQCIFVGSTSRQTCYASTGARCSGTTSCKLTVYGYWGQKVSWESSCGGYATTILDRKHETVRFSCPDAATTETITCDFGGSPRLESCRSVRYGYSCSGVGSCKVKIRTLHGERVAWDSSCGATAHTTTDGKDETAHFRCLPTVKERVTCLFKNTSKPQTCAVSSGQSCVGLPCAIDLAGPLGQKLTWKACGQSAISVMDGHDEAVSFDCGPEVTDVVTCVFDGSNTKQECYAAGGSGCSGIGSCALKVSGRPGEKLTWKSSCGGYAYTVIDGRNDTAHFSCGATVTESVTCYFGPGYQHCYTSDGRARCAGYGSCTTKVSGKQGERLMWKSSCGDYAYTTMDGRSEKAWFGCTSYGDSGPHPSPDAGVGPSPDFGYVWPDAAVSCTPDDPQTPLLNEDSCPSGYSCKNQRCVR